jgi:uncharacterized protein YjaG (DUF416 family)
VAIDKELYRAAYQEYEAWNRIEAVARAKSSERLSAAEAWQRYAALVELCWRLAPEYSQRQRQEKLAAIDRYYDAVRRLETLRQERGTTT